MTAKILLFERYKNAIMLLPSRLTDGLIMRHPEFQGVPAGKILGTELIYGIFIRPASQFKNH
jgi:hypothetical protein